MKLSGCLCGYLAEWCCSGESVGSLGTETEYFGCGHEHVVTAHLCRISEKQECAGHECHIENVVACASEHFLDKYHRESCGYCNHPKRCFYGAYKRNQNAGHKKTFLDLFVAQLRDDKFNSESHHIGHYYSGENGKESVGHY